MGRRDKSRSSSNWWADSKEPLPKCKNTYRHGEWRSEVEQHQKFSSDEIGSPSVDLQNTIASPPPNLPPVFARSMTPPTDNSPPADTSELPLYWLPQRILFRHSHGGTGCGSVNNPFFASRASFSNTSKTVSPDAYFRYHQHQPSLTSV